MHHTASLPTHPPRAVVQRYVVGGRRMDLGRSVRRRGVSEFRTCTGGVGEVRVVQLPG